MSKKIVLKVSITSDRRKTCVMTTAAQLCGIKSLALDAEKNTLTVVGEVDVVCVVKALRKAKAGVEVVSVGPNKPDKPEPCKPTCVEPPCVGPLCKPTCVEPHCVGPLCKRSCVGPLCKPSCVGGPPNPCSGGKPRCVGLPKPYCGSKACDKFVLYDEQPYPYGCVIV